MTDQQLQLALAKMLPNKIMRLVIAGVPKASPMMNVYRWRNSLQSVLNTEWLHVCWLVEQTLSMAQWVNYEQLICWCSCQDLSPQDLPLLRRRITCATWQQRAEALCKVKGIEV